MAKQELKCKYCGSTMYLLWSGSIENYSCGTCGAHRYKSDRTEETWFTKEEWASWIEDIYND